MLESAPLMYVFWQMVYALTLTVLVEEGVAFFLGIRSREAAFEILVINCFTNPILNALLLAIRFLFSQSLTDEVFFYGVIGMLEVVVVLTEGIYFAKKKIKCRNPFLFSFFINMASFAGGMLISRCFEVLG